MDIKPILGYDELSYMLMVGHEYVPEKRFLDTALRDIFSPLLSPWLYIGKHFI